MNDFHDRTGVSRRKPRNLFVFGIGAFLCGALLIIAITPALMGQTAQAINPAQDQAYFNTLQSVYRHILNNYVDQVDPKILFEGAVRGMFESLKDPHTAFLDAGEMRSLADTTVGEFGGLGMYIDKQRDNEGALVPNGFVEVISPIEGTPAWSAGMMPGDLIVEIDGTDTADLSTDQALTMLRGRPGSPVELRVFRGRSMDLKVPLVRQIIEIPTVKYAMIGTVAYIRLIQFTPKSTERMIEALRSLKTNNYTALVFDLRNNPGGVLDGAVEIGDLFFSDGTIVSTKGRVSSENHVYRARAGQEVDARIPMVVLMNEGSASASEIVGGALKDRGRALFIGEKSYGKGSVQQVKGIGETGFRMTIARYYTPADISIDKVGIVPDIVVSEPSLTREEELSFLHLREQGLVTAFVSQNKNPTSIQIRDFIAGLSAKAIVLPESIIKRLIMREVERQNNVNPVYDLENDIQLQKALEIIKEGRVQALIDARPKNNPALATQTQGQTPSGLPPPRSP